MDIKKDITNLICTICILYMYCMLQYITYCMCCMYVYIYIYIYIYYIALLIYSTYGERQ